MKLDFKKAYDSVRWSFMDHVLESMGFGQLWRKWVWGCMSSATMSILVNGSPTKPFLMQRELRQGDPLSPFLFVIVAEVLNRMISKAKEVGLIEGLQVGKG